MGSTRKRPQGYCTHSRNFGAYGKKLPQVGPVKAWMRNYFIRRGPGDEVQADQHLI